jgi:hypothetical protein
MQNDTTATRHAPISSRALAVIRGLRRTARAPNVVGSVSLVDDHRWVTVDRVAGGFFFVSIEGAELRRGDDLADADLLQAGFVDAMARVGAKKTVASATS